APAAAAAGTPAAAAKAAKKTTAPKPAAAPAQPPPAPGMVWVNLTTKVFHREGDRWYGNTKNGKYMTEADAVAAGYREAKNTPKPKEGHSRTKGDQRHVEETARNRAPARHAARHLPPVDRARRGAQDLPGHRTGARADGR